MVREFKKGERFEKETDHPYNDFEWYNRNPELLKQAAQFPFGSPVGDTFRAMTYFPKSSFPNAAFSASLQGYAGAAHSIPGILTIGIAPTVGVSTDQGSPINIASLANYDFVRKANSGARNYDWPDLTLYYMAMDSIYMYWSWLRKIYGCMMVFDAQNRYLPRAILESMGVDYDDVANNLADFRLRLNLKANQISSLAVPKTMEFMIRHSWLMKNIFMDQETPKAQFYYFVPSWVYKFSERTSDKGGELLPVKVCQRLTYNLKGECTNKFKTKDLLGILDELVNAVLTSEDLGTMSGDIMKAYGENLFMLGNVEEDYRVEPVYDQMVLSQISNLTVIPIDTATDISTFKIYQDPATNLIQWNPSFTDAEMCGQSYAMLNLHKATPDVVDIAEATRLIAIATRNATSEPFRFGAVGSEFVTGMYIHSLSGCNSTIEGNYLWYKTAFIPGAANADPVKLRSLYFDPSQIMDATAADTYKPVEFVLRLMMYSNFDWAPILRTFYKAGSGVWEFPLFGDIDNFTMIPMENLQSLHLVCLTSMFDVPGK